MLLDIGLYYRILIEPAPRVVCAVVRLTRVPCERISFVAQLLECHGG
jgi:hypothetical protein